MKLPLGFGGLVEGLRRATVLVSGRGGSGSGVVIDPDGQIVTNAHVVRTDHPEVQFWDGRVLRADLKLRDQGRDLALLSVPAGGLPAAPFGDSARLRAGELVVAVGNPLGFIGAVTTGVVHAIGPVSGLGAAQWIQSDLQLAPGNSGGPLAGASGHIIGLNTMIAGRLALALPGNTVRRFVASQQPRERLGVALRHVAMNVNGNPRHGLLLLEVTKESPADVAALMPGDIIICAGPSPVQSPEDLEDALAGNGERAIHIQFLRGGRAAVRKTTVVLGVDQSRAA